MEFTIYYHRSGAVTIEAETEEEARAAFEEMSDRELDDNFFCHGYELDSVE